MTPAERGVHTRRGRPPQAVACPASPGTQISVKGNPPVQLQRNSFKQALAASRLQIGLWCSLTSNIAAEIVADSGFDWLLLDSEHAPNEIPGLLSQLQAIRHGPAVPVVRVAWNDLVMIKRALDIGAQSLLVPLIDNAAQAQRAVRATGAPPRRRPATAATQGG